MRRIPALNWIGVLFALTLTMLAPARAEGDAGPPLPPPRPDRGAAPASVGPVTPAKPDEPAEARANPDETCRERLTRLGVRFESKPAIQERACAVQDTVLVSSLPDDLAVSPASLMTCPLAESLATWAKDVLTVEAEKNFRSKPKKLLVGTSYQCRNQRSGGKLSEHAFGNAVDIMGFEFAERSSLAIGSHVEGSPEAAFQSAVQKGACPVFTTVLGPGADSDHGDHLHLDMRARKGDYRICQ
jgi:hypothetical protein